MSTTLDAAVVAPSHPVDRIRDAQTAVAVRRVVDLLEQAQAELAVVSSDLNDREAHDAVRSVLSYQDSWLNTLIASLRAQVGTLARRADVRLSEVEAEFRKAGGA